MPRLVKGQVASGIFAKSETIMLSVKRRVEIFSEIVATNPHAHELLNAYVSAETLAAWSDLEMGVTPVSVKTLRKHIVLFHPEGLADICEKARALLRSVSDQPDRTRPSRTKLQAERAIDSALEMTVRYLDILERIKKLSHKSGDIENELSKHFRKFGRNPHVKEAQ